MECCFCKKDVGEYGNDPYPVKEDAVCCDKCNLEIVIPIRILQINK